MDRTPYFGNSLVMTEHHARILRAELSKAINAGGPIVLVISDSAAGPNYKILTINDDAINNRLSKHVIATVVKPNTRLKVEEFETDHSLDQILVEDFNIPGHFDALPSEWDRTKN